jgi:hypothetical protein
MGRYAMWLGGGAAIRGAGVMTLAHHADGRAEYANPFGAGIVLVHFTTPVIINDARARLEKVIVQYETPGENKITRIDVRDGPRTVAQRTGMPTGDYSGGLVPENVIEIPERPEILYGVYLQIDWEAAGGYPSSMLFRGFGADFIA